MSAMKPEWPLYGLGALMALVVGILTEILGWSEDTRDLVLGAGIALLLFTYLPRIETRRGRRGGSAGSARG